MLGISKGGSFLTKQRENHVSKIISVRYKGRNVCEKLFQHLQPLKGLILAWLETSMTTDVLKQCLIDEDTQVNKSRQWDQLKHPVEFLLL